MVILTRIVKNLLHKIGLVHQFRINFMTRKKRRSTLPGIWGCHSLSWRRWRIFSNWFLAVSHVKVQFSETFCLIFVVQGYLTFVKFLSYNISTEKSQTIAAEMDLSQIVWIAICYSLWFQLILITQYVFYWRVLSSSVLWWNLSLCVKL